MSDNEETEARDAKERLMMRFRTFIDEHKRGPTYKELGQSFHIPSTGAWSVLPHAKELRDAFGTESLFEAYQEAFRYLNMPMPEIIHPDIHPTTLLKEPDPDVTPVLLRVPTPTVELVLATTKAHNDELPPPRAVPPPRPPRPAFLPQETGGPVIPLRPKPGWGDPPKR